MVKLPVHFCYNYFFCRLIASKSFALFFVLSSKVKYNFPYFTFSVKSKIRIDICSELLNSSNA